MTIVTSYDWESDSWVQHNGNNPARTAWREAVSEIAAKAKATLSECNGCVDAAVKMVLAGDVELLAEGKAKVASQSNGTMKYFVVNGECSCPDFAKAPSNWCKHRIAASIAKRAAAQVRAQWDAATNGQTAPSSQPALPETSPATSTPPLPEAPASANVPVTLAGRTVQVTLRDSDEQRLLARLEALLQRFPVEDESAQEPAEGWCSTHGVQMKRQHNEHGSWWSHKTTDGWCKGK
jgi:hypothetical protein